MIKRIELDNVVPKFLENEKSLVSESEIWGKKVSFERGRRYLVEAASGTGKTTLCTFIAGMRKDYSGVIKYDETPSTALSKSSYSRLRREAIGWLPQEMGLFPSLTVWENIEIKNRLTRFMDPETVKQYLDRLGILEKSDQKVATLSVGQQQRVAFIRMLCQPADFFLLDEPVSHLDKENNKLMSVILDEVLSDTGSSAIVTSVGNHLELKDMIRMKL